mgnify:CR=1 FL=1
MESKKNEIKLANNNYKNSCIKNILNKYNDSKEIKLIGKELKYIENSIIFQFYGTIYKTTEINPFSSEVSLSFQFIENKHPYIHILNDFINPTLNDGRNIFYCLTNKHNYKFDKKKMDEFESIFDELIKGIKPFFLCLKENIQINVFIYYGDYIVGHIYQINDFLLNKNTVKFYRLIQINGKNESLKYVLITQLYYLFFEPMANDMSWAKLENFYYLKDINFSLEEGNFNKKTNKTSYILKIINSNLNSLSEIEFLLYSDDNKEDPNKYLEFKNSLNNKKNEINLKKYKMVITNYKPLFTIEIKKNNKKNREIPNMKSMYDDYKLYIKYFEELYNYYKDFKEENIKKRAKTFLSNLTYYCVDFITFYDTNQEEVQYYQSLMLKYLNNSEIDSLVNN